MQVFGWFLVMVDGLIEILVFVLEVIIFQKLGLQLMSACNKQAASFGTVRCFV